MKLSGQEFHVSELDKISEEIITKYINKMKGE